MVERPGCRLELKKVPGIEFLLNIMRNAAMKSKYDNYLISSARKSRRNLENDTERLGSATKKKNSEGNNSDCCSFGENSQEDQEKSLFLGSGPKVLSKNGKRKTKELSVSQFSRLLVLLRDEEDLRDAWIKSQHGLSMKELDMEVTARSFWTTIVAPPYNDESINPSVKFTY